MFCYTVTAVLSSKDAADTYINWLKNGHIQALLPWALDAQVILLDSDQNDSLVRIQSAYRFANQEDFEKYQSQGAPKLQAEGKELAQKLGGITFSRTWGTQIAFAQRTQN